MRSKLGGRLLLAGAIALATLGIAPAAHAWGTGYYVAASCWRPWGSATLTWGFDAKNVTNVAGNTYPHYVYAYADLKYQGSRQDNIWEEGTGWVDGRKDRGGVTGGRVWSVFANASDGQTWLNGNECWVT
ncbi:hypothetical protein ABTZ99_07980 [Actinosynnema sp. NPDC002837]